MNILQKFLESNHQFSDSELPLKFKFRLLNTIMGVIVVTATTFGVLHYLGLAPLGDFHANINFFFATTNLFLIFWLRRYITVYNKAVTLMLISSLITFTSALIMVPGDELRIIWFYITVFLAFFAGGITYGYLTAAASITIIIVSNIFFDLNLSELAITTAIVGLVLLTIAIKVYTQKMVDLEEALTTLNNSLHAKVESSIDEIRKKDEAMLQQARLAQMGELIAMIAHQWRQPLSSISAISANMQLSLALNENIDKTELQGELLNIDERVTLLSHTIDDFRNFYNTNKERSFFDLSDTINQAIEILNPSLHNAQIKLHFQNQLKQPLKSLESELIQVLINIIKNAIDILSERDQEREIWINAFEEKESVYIFIEDNAGGIDKKIHTKIFNPYFSTKKEKNGMGLGLYMSKLIIQEHCKGMLQVSNTDQGALFSIILPKEE